MPKSSALFAVCFVAGLLGALGSNLFLWQCQQWGLINLIGVKVVQTLSLTELYPQLFIGGFWGLGYFFTVGIPRHRRHWIRKGLWFSLIPAAVTLFYVYAHSATGRHHQSGVGILHRFFCPAAVGTLGVAQRSFLILVVLLFLATAVAAKTLTGRVEWIYDGDTIKVEKIGRVRLILV